MNTSKNLLLRVALLGLAAPFALPALRAGEPAPVTASDGSAVAPSTGSSLPTPAKKKKRHRKKPPANPAQGQSDSSGASPAVPAGG